MRLKRQEEWAAIKRQVLQRSHPSVLNAYHCVNPTAICALLVGCMHTTRHWTVAHRNK